MDAIVRLAHEDDAAAVAAIYAPEVLETPISFELVPPTAAEMRQRLAATLAGHPWLVAVVDGEVRGYAYASTHRERAAYRWSADVSAYLARTARGRGLGRALYTALLELLPLYGFTRAHAGITLPNAASIGLHEAMGFRPVGVYRDVGFKLGRWHDVGWWDLALGPRPESPAEPRPTAVVRADEAFARALERGTALLRAVLR